VPATAAGAALTLEWREGERRTTAGADVRHVRGETREDFLFSGGALARRRFAGGAQTLGGVFVAHDRPVGEKWRGTASFRADGWQLADGRRREVERATGAVLRDERFADHRRATWSGTAGIVWTPQPGWRGRAAAYRSFRVPTLNELYRPFRVGNVNTEANPALRHETLLGAEIGGDYQRGGLAFSVTGFAHRLENAVGNVTLASTPTLVSRQRRNLDCIEARGAEARAAWQGPARLAVEAAWLWSDAEIIRATGQPDLVGRRLPQVPQHVATAALHWEFMPSWTLLAQGRWSDRQFEDDDNTLALGAAGVLDLQVNKRLTEHSTVTVAVENATDTAVPVARSANGLTSYAAPRTWRASWRLTW
jgi:outer membrane receptor protein involved in Fe transport